MSHTYIGLIFTGIRGEKNAKVSINNNNKKKNINIIRTNYIINKVSTAHYIPLTRGRYVSTAGMFMGDFSMLFETGESAETEKGGTSKRQLQYLLP